MVPKIRDRPDHSQIVERIAFLKALLSKKLNGVIWRNRGGASVPPFFIMNKQEEQEPMNDTSGSFPWLGESIAAIAVAVGVTGAWIRDRLAVSKQLAELKAGHKEQSAKLDMLIALFTARESQRE